LLPLSVALNSAPDAFEEEEEAEAEEASELPDAQPQKQDPASSYQCLMVEKRRKNWGLQQRFNYEGEPTGRDLEASKQHTEGQSPARAASQAGVGGGCEAESVKIVVNERLKQYLFD
jgi:hypothetical protein